jgi:prepilin-type N-terminal cleavage/methylation domain-containing protein
MESRAFTLIEIIVVAAIVSVLGYFAVPRVAADLKMRKAERNVQATATAAETAAATATAAQSKVDASEVATGRGIQRENTQARAALTLLPVSPVTGFISDRLANIDLFSNRLYGTPAEQEAKEWRDLAFKVFATAEKDRADAAAQIAAQNTQMSSLLAQLDTSRHEKDEAFRAKARADAEAKQSRQELVKAQAETDAANGLTAALQFALALAVGYWLLSWIVAKLAAGSPLFASASNLLHTVIAPGLQGAFTKAKAEAAHFQQRTGELFGRIRAEMPHVAEELRALGNQVFDEAHKEIIGPIAEEAHKASLLAKAEAQKLVGVPPPKPTS